MQTEKQYGAKLVDMLPYLGEVIGERHDKGDFHQLRRLEGDVTSSADRDTKPRGIVGSADVQSQTQQGHQHQNQGNTGEDRPETADCAVIDFGDDNRGDQSGGAGNHLNHIIACAQPRRLRRGINQQASIGRRRRAERQQQPVGIADVSGNAAFNFLKKSQWRAPYLPLRFRGYGFHYSRFCPMIQD